MIVSIAAMIRAAAPGPLAALRRARGLSQAQLAHAAGVSRPEISAVETGRVAPSVTVALALARALGRSVEELFGATSAPARVEWTGGAPGEGARLWLARVGDRLVGFPCEVTETCVPAQARLRGREPRWLGPDRSDELLVIAGCDPAVGLLARELERQHGIALLALPRSSRSALDLLARGLVHAAGIHLEATGHGHAELARAAIGSCALLRVTHWEQGVALAPGTGPRALSALRAARWVSRPPGSGARAWMDRVLGARGAGRTRREASDQRGVATALRQGWATAGICVRLVAEDAGLPWRALGREPYDLVLPEALRDDRRVRALVATVGSRAFRAQLAELPGYHAGETGALTPALAA